MTTVIFVTPIVLATIRRLGVPASPVLLPLVRAANIGGTATLIGDSPNMWRARQLRRAMPWAACPHASLLEVAGEIVDSGPLR